MANQLDVAQAQFIGFRHGKWNRQDIVGLVTSMGLTKSEWKKLKESYTVENDIDEDDLQEIEDYFSEDKSH